MRLSSEKQVSAKVRRCVEKHQLGIPRIRYENGAASRLNVIIGLVALLIGGCIIETYYFFYNTIFSWWPASQALLVQLIGVAWLLVGVWIILPPVFFPSVSLFLCPKGLIYSRRKLDVIRWDHIEKLWKIVNVDKQANITYSYSIRRTDGVVFTLKHNLPYLDRLGSFLEREVTRQQLDQALATYNEGQVLDFTNLLLTRQGIGNVEERKVLPWDELEKVSSDETTVSVRRKGDVWDWATFSISGIPNVDLLKEVVKHITCEPAFPPHIQAYNAGFFVFFGSLRISKVGIGVNNGEDILPWSEIASFGLGESEIIIRRKSRLHEWYTVPLGTISDLPALKELLDYILYGVLH